MTAIEIIDTQVARRLDGDVSTIAAHRHTKTVLQKSNRPTKGNRSTKKNTKQEARKKNIPYNKNQTARDSNTQRKRGTNLKIKWKKATYC